MGHYIHSTKSECYLFTHQLFYTLLDNSKINDQIFSESDILEHLHIVPELEYP